MENIILNEAIKQISRYGFKKFTMADIAKAAKISKKTIYKYYASKDQLIKELLDNIIKREISENLDIFNSNAPITEKLEKLIMINLNQEIPIHYINELQFQYPHLWGKIEEFIIFKQNNAENLIKQGIDQGVIRDDIDPALIVMGIESLVFSIIEKNQMMSQQINLSALLKSVGSIFLYGITTPNFKEAQNEK